MESSRSASSAIMYRQFAALRLAKREQLNICLARTQARCVQITSERLLGIGRGSFDSLRDERASAAGSSACSLKTISKHAVLQAPHARFRQAKR